MISQSEHEHVSVEGRSELLSHDEQTIRLRERMWTATLNEELVVQDPVVLVRDLLVDDVLVFGVRHHHEIL